MKWGLVFFSIYLVLLISGPVIPVTGDQKTYIAIALESLSRNSWIVPYWMGEPTFLKPPLLQWLQMAGFSVGGSIWAFAVLPSLLSGIAIMAFMWRELGSQSLWLFGTLGGFSFFGVGQMEGLVAFEHFAFWWVLRQRRFHWALVLIAAAMMLTKSPLYLVLALAGVPFYETGYRGHFGKIISYSGLGIVLGGVWYFLAYRAAPTEFVLQYFGRESFGKISGNSSSLFGIWWALVLFLIPLIFLVRPSRGSPRVVDRDDWRWLLCAAVPSALFFTAFPYRVSTYLFVIFPVIVFFVLKYFVPPKGRALSFALWSLMIAQGVVHHFGQRDVEGLRAVQGVREWAACVNDPSIWDENAFLSLFLGAPIRVIRDDSKEKINCLQWLQSDRSRALILNSFNDIPPSFSKLNSTVWPRLTRRKEWRAIFGRDEWPGSLIDLFFQSNSLILRN